MFSKRFSKLTSATSESACGTRPNCVCSVCSPENSHFIEPLAGLGPSPIETLTETVTSMDRVKIVARDDGYLHVEFRSALLGFVDDVEFVVDGEVTHVRSASRVGYGDHEVNRKRVEEIRQRVNDRTSKGNEA